ncbi:antibiotic biosynthesis monooxygenase [Sedimentimonas flavescens]|uniref:Antibiotic biosynthesis monooxygenase n=1 Tax=Sedimentimonas flavescens TaxID=2851012 RepID=A0ABT2ZYJ4_9RHOB|nr:antibiotic biosynthesis monooxygenase [Sedimentimonas flavescens]MCV2878385.1 antibiotic biosynthesis monooxygenase [Sedimentimonas flavescens]
MALYLSGRLICSDAKQAEIVRAHLPEHIRLTHLEPGCLSFQVTQTADPLVWTVEEAFTDRAAFEAHQARTRVSDWGKATTDIPRDYELRED